MLCILNYGLNFYAGCYSRMVQHCIILKRKQVGNHKLDASSRRGFVGFFFNSIWVHNGFIYLFIASSVYALSILDSQLDVILSRREQPLNAKGVTLTSFVNNSKINKATFQYGQISRQNILRPRYHAQASA